MGFAVVVISFQVSGCAPPGCSVFPSLAATLPPPPRASAQAHELAEGGVGVVHTQLLEDGGEVGV